MTKFIEDRNLYHKKINDDHYIREHINKVIQTNPILHKHNFFTGPEKYKKE